VGLVALGAPLLEASAVQGAMGTSKTLLAQNRPSLISVTVAGPAGVDYCFATPAGETIQPPAGGYVPGDFWVGGYDQESFQAATAIVPQSSRCVQASFGGGIDLPSYSYGGVDGATVTSPANAPAVVANIGGSLKGNLADSAPLNGSTTHNGTRNFTTGPDLQTALVDGPNNRIGYVYDQKVDKATLCGPDGPGAGCTTNQFWFLDLAGNVHGALGAAIIDVTNNVVTVQFFNGPPFPSLGDVATNAVVALNNQNAKAGCAACGNLASQTPNPETGNPLLSVAVPQTGGGTNKPDLVSASLVGNGTTNQVDFLFDVAISNPLASSFRVNTSDNSVIVGQSAVVLADGRTVRVTFPQSTDKVTEFLVAAHVLFDAVVTSGGNVGSAVGGKPLGGNIGAFSLGYTTGPDAQALTINGSTGAVVATMDQRVNSATIDLSKVRMINAQGTIIGLAPFTASVSNTSTPGSVRVTFQFDPVFAPQAAGLQIDGKPTLGSSLLTFSGVGFTQEGNVEQVFAK
jgi:hypothetical protein